MNTHPFPQDFLSYLETNTLIEVKGGKDRDKFLSIWMVEVDRRVFARSWAKSGRSWFTAFVKQGVGELKYGEKVIAVTGKPLKDLQTNVLVDQAYLKKYIQEHNLIYARGITQPEYHAYTMEFLFEKVINLIPKEQFQSTLGK